MIDTSKRGFAGKCLKSEKPLSWSQQGPRGLQGIQGLQGNPGTNGTNGVNGADGTARAYDLVLGNVLNNGTATVTHSKNITGATYPTPGVY